MNVNERDGLGDGLVPDYFTRIERGQFYGWPWVYLSKQNVDPRFSEDQLPSSDLLESTVEPDLLYQSHTAALGVAFYDGTTFPEKYHNGAFSALHGSWNRSEPVGYSVVFVPFSAEHRPEGYYEDFVTGFVSDPDGPAVWGRPVGVLVTRDGDLLFTDDENGRVYRVAYERKLGD